MLIAVAPAVDLPARARKSRWQFAIRAAAVKRGRARYNRKHTGHRVMGHKAGLRARFVRNSIGGGSHDPRNWIGCVSRREETTTVGERGGGGPRAAVSASSHVNGEARKRDDLIGEPDTDRGIRIDRRIIGSCRDWMNDQSPVEPGRRKWMNRQTSVSFERERRRFRHAV